MVDMSSNSELLNQLNALLRLTQTEIMIAETRRAQATTKAVERELAVNSDKARERSRLLADSIRRHGGVPDVAGMAVARLAANAKAAAEQGQDFTDALLGDLALEHELLDRARFAKMLAEQLDETGTGRVLDRLETAHEATVQWLMTRLAEIAVGGPVALRPSPTQVIAGFGRRMSTLPARQTADVVNRSVERLSQLRDRAGELVSTNVERTRQLAESAGSIWTAGRDASLKRSEEIADRRGDRSTARRVNQARRDLGAVQADELPIRQYGNLTAGTAVDRVRRLDDIDDVRTILAYETANKQRKSVLTATRDHIESLTEQFAAAS
jgi:bacterioferritin (cytochrome b1)